MKPQFRLFRRAGVFYAHDNQSGRQQSLRTRDKPEALRLLSALNEVGHSPQLNLALGRIYLAGHDPALVQRTWADVMRLTLKKGQETTRDRWKREIQATRYDTIRDKPLVETTSEDLFQVLRAGGSATNHFLRRLHNLAVGLHWLPWPILPNKLWPKPKASNRRAITGEEHQRVVESEGNSERRLFYQLLWETGASQSDAAALTHENVDWELGILVYQRRKMSGREDGRSDAPPAQIQIGPKLAEVLRKLPRSGPLFPKISATGPNQRASEFARRCRLLGLKGVSLHSYRYAWAERAKRAGYPERWAQVALGHNSKAVHRAYSRGGQFTYPSLDEFEEKIVHLNTSEKQMTVNEQC